MDNKTNTEACSRNVDSTISSDYRLLPVALHPAIEEALKRHCMMPNTAWQDVIAAADRVNRDAEKAVCQHCGPDGLTASDGSGPYDCYICGKKASQPTTELNGNTEKEILALLAEQKADVKQRDGDWWRGYEAALHWIGKSITEKQNNEDE